MNDVLVVCGGLPCSSRSRRISVCSSDWLWGSTYSLHLVSVGHGLCEHRSCKVGRASLLDCFCLGQRVVGACCVDVPEWCEEYRRRPLDLLLHHLHSLLRPEHKLGHDVFDDSL